MIPTPPPPPGYTDADLEGYTYIIEVSDKPTNGQLPSEWTTYLTLEGIAEVYHRRTQLTNLRSRFPAYQFRIRVEHTTSRVENY